MQGAEKHFRKAMEHDSENHVHYFNLGIILREQRRLKEAEKLLKKVVKMEPDLLVTTPILNDEGRSLKAVAFQIPCQSFARRRQAVPSAIFYVAITEQCDFNGALLLQDLL